MQEEEETKNLIIAALVLAVVLSGPLLDQFFGTTETIVKFYLGPLSIRFGPPSVVITLVIAYILVAWWNIRR